MILDLLQLTTTTIIIITTQHPHPPRLIGILLMEGP